MLKKEIMNLKPKLTEVFLSSFLEKQIWVYETISKKHIGFRIKQTTTTKKEIWM